MKILLLILALSCAAFGQTALSIDQIKAKSKTAPYKKLKYYGVGYDKFSDTSNVSFYSVISGKAGFLLSGSMTTFGAEFRFKGKTFDKNVDEFTLGVIGMSKFGKGEIAPRLYIVPDEKRFEFGGVSIDSRINTNIITGTQVTDRADFKISRADFETIVNSKSVEIKINDGIFSLKTEQVNGLKSVFVFGTL
ncbi:MAG TPA: hypothetical protein VNI84_03360 [Pyrinomonadaceae bacterium]|nr:hypothetical protein [Pyrinomonadaceae bacterium]